MQIILEKFRYNFGAPDTPLERALCRVASVADAAPLVRSHMEHWAALAQCRIVESPIPHGFRAFGDDGKEIARYDFWDVLAASINRRRKEQDALN